MKDDRIYLAHILDSIEHIESFITSGRDEFFKSRLIQDAVIRNLEIIGEAVKQLSMELDYKIMTCPGEKWQAYVMF